MKKDFNANISLVVFKVIFIICAIYFFIMGIALIFLPHLIIRGISEDYVSTTIIGMLRGAGGSIIPYSLLYILIVLNPLKRMWALYVILAANMTAIFLDVGSVILSEYKISYAMYDIPIEILSIVGIIIIWRISRYEKQ